MGRWDGMGGHSEQAGQYVTDGGYELRIPCRDPRGLGADILGNGLEVEVVVGSEALRAEVAEALRRALGQYGG